MAAMNSYYDIRARVRYYGQLPRNVRRKWESGHDPAGRSVKYEVVLGEMDFASDGFMSDAIPIPADKPVDLSQRRESVHEDLANLVLDAGSLYRFTKSWGFLNGQVEHNNRAFRTRPEDIAIYQSLLRRAWKGERRAIDDIARKVVARINVNPTGVEIAVDDPWNFASLLFLLDHAVGITKVCTNPDCSSPYFLQQRRGQKFCTHKCAVLINVRRFRERGVRNLKPTRGEK